MTTTIYLTFCIILLLLLLVGLWRVLKGPTLVDRMLAAQLFGTTVIAILLLLREVIDMQALYDVAMVFALLAAVVVVAFTRRVFVEREAGDEHN